MEVRLIDANALYREVKTECNPYGKPTIGFDDGKKVLKLIDAAPTIEAEPVRHGWWINAHKVNDGDFKKCSECSCYIEETYFANDYNVRYCPNCGAKMD